VWTVADQVGPLEGRGQLPVLNQIAFGQREDEVAVGDVNLRAGEALGVDAVLYRLDDLLRVVLSRRQEGVRHARQRLVAEALTAAVPRGLGPEMLRRQAVLHVADQGPV